jgi:hypothetical protein
VSKIPDCTQEIEQRLENNTSSLIELGVKEWMKKRRKKANMSELEQKEMLRKIEDKLETKDSS